MQALRDVRQIDYTVLFARDMARMREFYGTILGFPLQRELGPGWIEYRVGSCVLALTERGLMFDDPPPEPGALACMIALRVGRDEVDRCAVELAAVGVPAVLGPADQPWGHRTLYFRDPDGNMIEVYADI